ncbi:twitching motility protein PilT [Pseudomonas saponiphila]|jgi:twitching motility protein PilT|uniref:Twitching motility protein PilT n=1 Tax=Pseudomonas saponiphila TaxID=556534 RepID=A0A1H4ZRF6_9PSED|nr:ATPase, T2SS/T4P/T4SS family [Pseudomonas saponiphila]SED32074.1 twitching motility protein PilT [Pseudomonas saponiphila]
MTDIPAKPTNLYLTSNFVETTDNNGVYSRIACEGTWKDLFETTVAEKKKADRKKSSDFTIEWNGSRYRCNLADSYHGYGLTMRILPAGAPSFREDLKLDANIVLSLLKGTGLTLFAGQMGSGKSTTMFAALERMDKKERGPIGTVEDPIEGLLTGPGVIQREVGTHVDSFAQAIKDFVRQNRHTIAVSEIRDPETANAALMAASTGHSVVATIHADSALDVFPRMLALVDDKLAKILPRTMRGIWWQHVVRFGDSDRKPLPVYESLEVTNAVRQILEAGVDKLPQLGNEMQRQSRKSMAETAMQLVAQRLATRDEVAEFINRRGRINE